MCDNFKGWCNFSNNALGIHSNVYFPYGTSMMPYFLLAYAKNLMAGTAGIAAEKY